MGRFLGAFDPNDSLNRPDLNQCPDCGCFFAGLNCPLCGKECPEEFRAGNRRPVRESKQYWRTSRRAPAFVEWYHSWWCIILALLFFPVAGIILLITSPHKRSLKITVGCVIVAVFLLSTVGIGAIIRLIQNWGDPVDTSLSREEYVAACESVSAESIYRAADSLQGKFVTLTLTVTERFEDSDAQTYDGEYPTYYICRATDAAGKSFDIMLRDCLQASPMKFVAGDTLTVYGEIAGELTVYDMNYNPRTAPCIFVAYATLVS